MDTYSNILYVKEDFAALSNMAHRVIETDKYRPESCCIVGNYYSLKGQQEKVSPRGIPCGNASICPSVGSKSPPA